MMTLWSQTIARLPFEWAHYAFMQNALLAVVLLCPMLALLGCLVVNKQMAFFSEALGHAALTGIALGVIAAVPDPLWSMLAFSVFLALVISTLRRYSAASADTIIGLALSFAVALGVAILSRGGSFAKYSRYLIGDILTITPADIHRLGLMTIVVLAIWILAYNAFFLVSINHSLARSRGINIWLVEALFAVLVAVVVTISIPWVGLLIINSLLIIPAAAARNISCHSWQYAWLALGISLLSGVLGLILSFYLGTAAGATIVLFAMLLFFITLICRILR